MVFQVKLRGKYSYSSKEFDYTADSTSKTVPNDALSLRELLMRSVKGVFPDGVEHDVVYDDDSYDEVYPPMRQNADLTDFDDYKEEYDNLVNYEYRKSLSRRAARSAQSRKEARDSGETSRESVEYGSADE